MKKYFLAANSCDGFISFFNTAYDPKTGWRGYIIKGGPGTGKSTFMKKIASSANEKGYETVFCPCSSDPDSLDAVVIPKIKVTIMDGTAPHTVDPKYPAAVDTILNFGNYWDEKKISENRQNIITLTNENKALHKTAALYLSAAGEIIKDNYITVESSLNFDKIKKYSKKLRNKCIKGRGNSAGEKIRFLTGISPKGVISFEDTILSYCSNPVIIKDNFGCVSNHIMSEIRAFALENKYMIVTFKNPFLPKYIDHIVIPELNLAFVREYEFFNINCDMRRIHAERFINREKLKVKRLKYNAKTSKLLLNSAIDTLKKAKSVHDDLEDYYSKAMDFDALFDFATDFTNKILE